MAPIVTSCLDLTYNAADSPCSGNGFCNPVTLKCECDSGWTGQSDFLNFDGYNCQTNTAVIRALWSISLILSIFCVTRSVKIFLNEWAKCSQSWAKARKRPLVKLCLYIWICEVGFVIMAFGKISDLYNLTLEGSGLFGIFGFALAASTFYWFTGQLTVIQCSIALNGISTKPSEQRFVVIRRMVDNIWKKSAMDGFFVCTGVGVAVFGQAFDNENVVVSAYIMVGFWRGFTMILTVLQLTTIKLAVTAAFKGISMSGTEGQRILKVKSRMKTMVNDSFTAVAVNGVASVVFATYRPFFGLWSYFIVGQYILVQLIVFKIIKLFRKKKSYDKDGKLRKITKTTSDGDGLHSYSTGSKNLQSGRDTEGGRGSSYIERNSSKEFSQV